MLEHIKQIATRIKGLRDISGLSSEEMATRLNIPLEVYQSFESGNVDIPVSFLYEISNKFNMELTAILTGEDPKLHSYALVRRNKGVSVERRKEYNYQSLAYNFADKKAEPFLVTAQPEPEDSPVNLNSHPGQEFNYVLQGTLKIIINDNEIILNEGDSVYFDSSLSHGMKALNGKPSSFLAIII